jgi:hypothetical protein
MRAPRLFLFFAVLCAVVSVTPLGDDWRFLVLLAPEWMTVPNGVPFETPHEQLARVIVLAWHGLVTAGANSGWWSDAAAAAVIAEGFPVGGVLQLLAGILFVLAAFVWALGSVRQAPILDNPIAASAITAAANDVEQQGNPAPELTSAFAPDSQAAELTRPFLAQAISSSGQHVEPKFPDTPTASTAERIAQLEIAVTNLLLKPDAQSVSEELADLSRQLRELSRQLDSGPTPKS